MIHRQIPAQQQAIHVRCYHPSGEWEEFPRLALDGSVIARFEAMVARYPDRIDELAQDLVATNPEITIAPDAIAYLVYTSGTTGTPKGVIETHRNVLHYPACGCAHRLTPTCRNPQRSSAFSSPLPCGHRLSGKWGETWRSTPFSISQPLPIWHSCLRQQQLRPRRNLI